MTSTASQDGATMRPDSPFCWQQPKHRQNIWNNVFKTLDIRSWKTDPWETRNNWDEPNGRKHSGGDSQSTGEKKATQKEHNRKGPHLEFTFVMIRRMQVRKLLKAKEKKGPRWSTRTEGQECCLFSLARLKKYS